MNTRIHLVTRLVALLVLLSFQPKVHAQVDTVPEFDPHYLYQYPEDSLLPRYEIEGYSDRELHSWDAYLMEYHYVKEISAVFYYPGKSNISGIAVMLPTDWIGSRVEAHNLSVSDWYERLKLYGFNGETQLLASDTIRLTDCNRYMIYRGHYGFDYNYWNGNYTYYLGLLYIEFDSAITVVDSFMVSLTNEFLGYESFHAGLFKHRIPVYDHSVYIDTTPYPDSKFWVLDTNDVWHEKVRPCVMQIFPIVDLPEDTCPVVSNVHITGAYGSLVMAEWETAQNNSQWEVSYGPVGTEPDSGTIITCYTPMAKMLNLNVDSQYVVYVKPVCRFGITKRGEWSEGVVFNPLSGEVGIEHVADTEPLTLYPNPASGTVRIGLPEGLQGVDVRLYDMAGREVMRSTSLTLDVSHLPQGTYTVRAATTTGTRTGRLVVAE